MSADLHAAEERYSYDESGRLISVDYGGGQGIVYVYDTRGNLLRRQIIRFTDADEDFIDDEWERTHFNSIDRAGDLDFDKDGQTDLAEFLSGTDPTDPKSALRIRRISKLEGAPSFLIEWDAVSERVYQVQYKDDLDDVLWKDLGGRVTALGNVASLLDDTAEASGNRYYRISLVR